MVAVILPDGGRSYLSKIYNDAWMRQYGFLERDEALTVGDVLRRKHDEDEIPPLLTVETHAKVRDAVALLHEHRVSQLPVVSGHDPHTVVGSVSERGLLRHAMDDAALLGAEIVDVMEPPFPAVAAERRRPRGRRAARRQARGAAGEHGRARRGHRHARRPARVARAVTERARFATRAVHAGLEPDPDLRVGDPADPPDLDLRAAAPPGEFVERLRLRALGEPDARRARARARASSRAGSARASRAAWRRRTRC